MNDAIDCMFSIKRNFVLKSLLKMKPKILMLKHKYYVKGMHF